VAILALTAPFAAEAQTSVSEDFTQGPRPTPWYFFNGACPHGRKRARR
jgi:hypothetical protein